MSASIPTATFFLRRDDAYVLGAWLGWVDLNTIPMQHEAEKQALTDVYGWLEWYSTALEISADELEAARDEIAREVGERRDVEFAEVEVTLPISDMLVIYAWLAWVDLSAVPVEHESDRHALTALGASLINDFFDSSRASAEEIDAAREQVSRNMGW